MSDLNVLPSSLLTPPQAAATGYGDTSSLRPLHVITAEELAATQFPPRKLLLAPLLPEKGLVMIYGPRGIGKTHLTLNIAFAVATGGSFLRWHAPAPRRVVIIDGEMPGVVLQARWADILAAATVKPQPGFVRFLAADLQERDLDLSDPHHQAQLEPLIRDADLIIVDNISTLSKTGRENEAESWLTMQQWALAQRRAGRSVLFIHHAGKGGGQRGTSRREDVLDTVVALKQPQDYQSTEGARFEVHFEKNRGFHGLEAKAFEAALGPTGWTTRNLDNALAGRVLALKAEGATVREIAEEVGLSKSKVGRIVKGEEVSDTTTTA
jgi:putative DNA primase/helicase